MHLADAFIQSSLQCIQAIIFFYQYVKIILIYIYIQLYKLYKYIIKNTLWFFFSYIDSPKFLGVSVSLAIITQSCRKLQKYFSSDWWSQADEIKLNWNHFHKAGGTSGLTSLVGKGWMG